MAKLKNRTKRKAVVQKKVNQVKAGKPAMYEGYMRIPLSNSFTAEQTRNNTEYFGEWIDDQKRAEIMNEPRIFVVTGHIIMTDNKRYCATIDYQSYGGRETLPAAANLAFDAARNGSGLVDMSESYIVVRAQKDMTKFPKEIDVELLKAERNKKQPIMGLLNPFSHDHDWGLVA